MAKDIAIAVDENRCVAKQELPTSGNIVGE